MASERKKFKPPSWNSADDAKLLRLFRLGPNRNGADPSNTHYKYIQTTVLPRFFPDRVDDYKNFGPLYRKKAAKFILDREKNNSRGTGKRN